MKVQIIRQSMTPIEFEIHAQMMDEYQLNYDKLTEQSAGDMQKLHESLDNMIKDLTKRYEEHLSKEVDMPKTKKAWTELLDTYGAIIVGTHVDTGKLMLIVMDDQVQGISA